MQAILDSASDLLFEVRVPTSGDALASADKVRQLAFTECIRRIGEAVALIDSLDPTWLTEHFPDVPWQQIKSTRNRLTHRYWAVDYHILHEIAVRHLPSVTAPIAAYLDRQDPYRLFEDRLGADGAGATD